MSDVPDVSDDGVAVEGVVVEPLDGIDDLVAHVREFRPSRERRIGVLVDHLVAGSKESRIAAQVRDANVLINGHPYVDIWQAVKPTALGIDRWVMLFGGLDNIRDCIAFPKTQKAADLMTEAPGDVDARQLRDLGIQLRRSEEAGRR